ncbi:hypothetical protein [Chelativorans xinjiangense]|uniref:hypothetical protein n=1 Tax=Chelativorans xinjiangense TaxID=2681485 RepID=UPI00135AD350|nr:hypothetical protein [Chelativorans xinjiangense]
MKCVIRIGSVGIADAPGENRCQAALAGAMYLGGHWEHIFDIGGTTIRAQHSERLRNGDYWLDFPADRLWVFNRSC